MPSHASIRHCTSPLGVLYAESVADSAVHGDFTVHRAGVTALLIDGAKAGDDWWPTRPRGTDLLEGVPTVVDIGRNFIDLDWIETNTGDWPTIVYYMEGMPPGFWIPHTPTGTTPIHRVGNLEPNTQYSFTLRAYDPITMKFSLSGLFRTVTTLP